MCSRNIFVTIKRCACDVTYRIPLLFFYIEFEPIRFSFTQVLWLMYEFFGGCMYEIKQKIYSGTLAT